VVAYLDVKRARRNLLLKRHTIPLTWLSTRALNEQIIIEENRFGKRCLKAARLGDLEVAGTHRLPQVQAAGTLAALDWPRSESIS
jgi:hypothetical protein